MFISKEPSFSSGLYSTNIHAIKMYHSINQKFIDPAIFIIWYDRLGHSGVIMMRKIIENMHGDPLKS
jgi:hypothetical protein